MDQEDFVQRLAQLRTNKKVSARKMSLSIGQNENYINQIENRKSDLPMSTFLYICEYLGVTPKEFFDTETVNPVKANELLEVAKSLPNDQMELLIGVAKGLAQNQKPKKKHP